MIISEKNIINQLDRETIYSQKVGLEHRKKFAQFFTPYPIAKLMSAWILDNQNIKTILEPAFGLGIFSRIILESNNNLTIKGFDIDKTIFKEAKSYFEKYQNIKLYLKDYIFDDWNSKYDGIICNPPYFKFHDYDNKSNIEEIERKLNFKFNGLTNLYTLFLLKSVYQLALNGRATYIIPSEFLNSDYGTLVKEYLVKSKTIRHIFIIDFQETIFEDALTTTAILFLAKDNNYQEINISNITSLSDLSLIEKYINNYPSNGHYTIPTTKIDPNIKWRKYYQVQNSAQYKNLVNFSEYAKVVRGIATGSNDYFTFNKSKAIKYEIPHKNLLPCICKAADIKELFFTSKNYQEIEKLDKLVYLFNGINSEDINVKTYIQKGEEDKINEKYLTKNRRPWFSIENRPPAPIWVSVFNRNGLRFIKNEAGIYNLTTFHCIYPRESDLFFNIDLFFAYLLTDVAKQIFEDNRREYGNGLKKFEPNDINKSKMLDISKLTPQSKTKIISLLKKYRNSEISQKSDYNYLSEINTIFINEYT